MLVPSYTIVWVTCSSTMRSNDVFQLGLGHSRVNNILPHSNSRLIAGYTSMISANIRCGFILRPFSTKFSKNDSERSLFHRNISISSFIELSALLRAFRITLQTPFAYENSKHTIGLIDTMSAGKFMNL